MTFDFDQFTPIAAKAYEIAGSNYGFDEVLYVFRYYFWRYEQYRGRPHPKIKMEQIVRIIGEMPTVIIQDAGERDEYVTPEQYSYMIDKHFKTQYRFCDYNINHFFSGRVREMRFLET